MAMKNELVVRTVIILDADTSAVWEAITDPKWTRKYMYNSEVISDWKKGSSIIWRDADSKKVHVKGIILEIEPNKFLKTADLSIDAGLPDIDSNYSRVTYELTDENGKTKLLITEDHFNGDQKRYEDANHFWEIVLTGLKELFEH